ncbi:MAG: hydantoinase/oxoprolinase family protein [Acidimicrobiales bacterium]
MRVGVDTGGTFTDVVAEDGRVIKVPSTPDDPSRAVTAAVAERDDLVHGTTIATNALLERRGARVALITTEGFADLIEIARQDRPSLYDPFADRPVPLVDRDRRLEVRERTAADGEVLVSLGEVPNVPDDVDAVAVCLLHADLHPDHERRVAAILRARGCDVTASHEIAPEFREYERTVTTVINAYLRPICRSYLTALGPCDVLTSAGGLVPVAEAAERPAALLLSGPAGGVLAGAAAAVAAGFPDAVTFDMGGTSTDVCVVLDGAPAPAAQRHVGGFPVRLPSLDVYTIGAGGGSIARVDAGGALIVGPSSAGARPGPACYGLGGTRPTVTDADLVTGHLPEDIALPGIGRLHHDAATAALAGIDADGVLAVVDANMVEAVRAITVRRGIDPTTLALIAFGGAGPLHACGVAAALGMRAVVVPPRAGVLSAAGLLAAPRQADLVRSWASPRDHRGVDDALAELAQSAADRVGGDAVVHVAVDCRYEGQGHELTVGAVEAFESVHERVNGYRRPGAQVEVVALRASASVASAGAPRATVDRRPVVGPAAVAEADSTMWVPAGWSATVHGSGAWIVRRT